MFALRPWSIGQRCMGPCVRRDDQWFDKYLSNGLNFPATKNEQRGETHDAGDGREPHDKDAERSLDAVVPDLQGANDMTTQRLGLIMNGWTRRMGLTQHLIRSIIAIREQGGVRLANGDCVMPDPILVGRNADKVERLAKQFKVERWTTDLDKALADKSDTVFF